MHRQEVKYLLIALIKHSRHQIHSYSGAFTMEREECFSDKPKIECLPVSVDTSVCVHDSVQQGREII